MSEERELRVLVVDDDVGLQQLIATLLTRAKMAPVVVGTAADAAQVLLQKPLPDIVVLDMMLPDVSGLEFLRQVRSKRTFDKLPVIILSALADPDQIREGLASGADRYLTKPYLANNLISTIQDVVKHGRKKS